MSGEDLNGVFRAGKASKAAERVSAAAIRRISETAGRASKAVGSVSEGAKMAKDAGRASETERLWSQLIGPLS